MSTKLGTIMQTATTLPATPIPEDAQHVPVPSTKTQGQIDDLSKEIKIKEDWIFHRFFRYQTTAPVAGIPDVAGATTLIDEQFNNPTTATNSGIGVFTTSLNKLIEASGDKLWADGGYVVGVAGASPQTYHPYFTSTKFSDNSGFFVANLESFNANKPAVLKTTTNVIAGKMYRFTMEAMAANGDNPPILGLVVNGLVIDTVTITAIGIYEIDFIALNTETIELKIISNGTASSGNDIAINNIKLLEITVNGAVNEVCDTARVYRKRQGQIYEKVGANYTEIAIDKLNNSLNLATLTACTLPVTTEIIKNDIYF
jgi:hypothetical protein